MKLRSIVSVSVMALATAAFATGEYVTDKVCGYMRVDSTLPITAVGVPWVAVSNTAVNVAVVDYVMADNLTKGDSTTGDKLYLYDNSSNNWKAYYLNGSGKWTGFSVTKGTGNSSVTTTAGSDSDLIARGQALYLERSSPTNSDGTAKSFYLYGAVGSALASTIYSGANKYLVASPKAAAFTVTSAKISGASNKDVIQVPLAGGTSRTYQYFSSNNKWRCNGKWEGEAGYEDIPLGTGFWYLASSTSAITFTW